MSLASTISNSGGFILESKSNVEAENKSEIKKIKL